MKEVTVRRIYDELFPFMNNNWNKVGIIVRKEREDYNFSYFEHFGEDYIKNYDDTEEDLEKAFYNIRKFLMDEPFEKEWNKLYLCISSDGCYRVEVTNE